MKYSYKLDLPANSKITRAAGQINKDWWSNGGYDFTYKRKKFWRICLSREGKPNIGYNAVITKVGKSIKGLVWLDAATTNYSSKELAEKVMKEFVKKREKEKKK